MNWNIDLSISIIILSLEGTVFFGYLHRIKNSLSTLCGTLVSFPKLYEIHFRNLFNLEKLYPTSVLYACSYFIIVCSAIRHIFPKTIACNLR